MDACYRRGGPAEPDFRATSLDGLVWRKTTARALLIERLIELLIDVSRGWAGGLGEWD